MAIGDFHKAFRARARKSARAGIVGWSVIIAGATLMLIALFGTHGFLHPKPWLMLGVYGCFLGIAVLMIHQKLKTLRRFRD